MLLLHPGSWFKSWVEQESKWGQEEREEEIMQLHHCTLLDLSVLGGVYVCVCTHAYVSATAIFWTVSKLLNSAS